MLLNGALDKEKTQATTTSQHEAIDAEMFALLPGTDEDIIMVKESRPSSAKETEGNAKGYYTSPKGRDYKKKVSA